MFGGRGRKWAGWFGLIISVLLISMLFGLVGDLKPVQADGGAYTINFSAANPDIYLPEIPFPTTATPIVGRGNGDDEIPKAWYNDPNTLTDVKIESLNPRKMALCQIVPFEIKISAGVGAEAIDDPITFVAGWSTVTTNGGLFGYDPGYGVYAAFVDTGDGAHVDPVGDALVSTFSSALVGDEIQGTISVSGLQAGDVVVVEVWLVLQCSIPEKIGGNVASRLISGSTAAGDTINTGNQTVPMLQVGNFTSSAVDLQLTKDDDDIYKLVYEPFWYEIVVSYPLFEDLDTVANGVVVVDTLDPWLEYLGDDGILAYETTFSDDLGGLRTCTYTAGTNGFGGTLTCNLIAIAESDSVTITFWVQAVNGVHLAASCEGIDDPPVPGTSCDECPPNPPFTTEFGQCDVCNRAEVTTISNDTDLTNNWDEEFKDIRDPNAADIINFRATSDLVRQIKLEWGTENVIDLKGFNIYRAIKEDGHRLMINKDLIDRTFLESEYEFLDTRVNHVHTYYYWLELVDYSGDTAFYGPITGSAVKK